MKILNIDEWSRVFPSKTKGPQPDAEAVFGALATLSPTAVKCYRAEGFPWIEVWFKEDVPLRPSDVLNVGEALAATISAELFFQALRPNSTVFLFDMPLADGDNGPELPASSYGVRFYDLLKAWEQSAAPGVVSKRRRANARGANTA